jgi:hypothetical protein
MSSLTPSRLVGIRAKIERAKEHIRDLNAEWQAFRATDSYGIRVDLDPQTGERVYRFEIRQQISIDIATIIGDAVHNLRSALDHLACQLVEANGRTATNRTAYPIRDTPQKVTVQPAAISLGAGSFWRWAHKAS